MVETSENSNELLIKYQVAVSNLTQQRKYLDELDITASELTGKIEDWNGAKILLELLKNFKLEKRKEFILNVVNSALKDIFESNYRLDIQPRDTKGKSAASTQKYDIIFYQNDIEIARNNELLASNGGGVLSIASLFFKILIGYLYSKNKFYIFDEALSQVSPQYRTRLSLFLKEFCEKYDFTLVIVSQTEELEDHAHIVYEVDAGLDSNKVPILNIAEVHGEEPTENYFWSSIKNFQSIVDLTFKFKGFTIIRGPNNSGKSASLRAIEAILFNNFKTETYPRKNPGGKKLTTEITFGFTTKDQVLQIGLKYKSGKVMFVIDGQEYFGKSLAADKVREAVEKIGFRYIDVKKMYKNFKGDLKEQTERIAYTNQYDGLFLIGAKTTDSEKIFSFLFNTENIALAIAQSKETLQELSKEHKDLQQEQIQSQELIRRLKIEVDFYSKKYYLAIIQEYKYAITALDNIKEKSTAINNLLKAYNNFTTLGEYLSKLTELKNSEMAIQNKKEHNNKKVNIINSILNLVSWTAVIQQYLNTVASIDTAKPRIDYTEQLKSVIKRLVGVKELISINENIKELNFALSSFSTKRENLNNQFRMHVCDICNGTGVIAQ